MKYTGERFVPGAWDVEPTFQGKMWQEHLARYAFGRAFVRGKTVLDVGCGVGYGAGILMAGGARSVVGVDISLEAIRYAGERNGQRGVTFIAADAASLPFGDKRFDAVLAFESIEHLGDPEAFVREVRRVLNDRGAFVVSTPRRRGPLRSRFHTREFDLAEFEELLRGAFTNCVFYGENNCFTTIIGREPRFTAFSSVDFTTDLQVKDSDYLIAVCGELPSLPGTVAVVNSDAYVLNLESRVARLQAAEQRLHEAQRQRPHQPVPRALPLKAWRLYRGAGMGGIANRVVLHTLVRLGLAMYPPPGVPSAVDRAWTLWKTQGAAGLWRSAPGYYRRVQKARHLIGGSGGQRPPVVQGQIPSPAAPAGPVAWSDGGTRGTSAQVPAAKGGVSAAGRTAHTPLRVGWVIPPPLAGSGGHRNIFRAARHLAAAGHAVSLYVHGGEGPESGEMEKVIEAELGDASVRVIPDTDGIEPGDALFATHWSTVEVVTRNRDKASCLLYFVQDVEPYFYPMSYEYIRAERTYREGLGIITSGPWCARVLRERYGVDAEWFAFPVDRRVYHPRPDVRREHDVIAYFARPEMPRRLFPLGVEALRILKSRRPKLSVVLFGSDSIPGDLPFEHLNLGLMLDMNAVARLYSAATVGLAFSATNPSLVPYELMACGCPIVDIDYGDSYLHYGSRENAALAQPTPEGVAVQIEALLADELLRDRVAQHGYQFVQSFPGEAEVGKTIERFVLKYVAASAGHVAPAARTPLTKWAGGQIGG